MEEKIRKTNRKYTEEFKNEAVQLAIKVGYSQAGQELGINESYIRTWKSQFKKKSFDPKKKSYDEIEKELRKLTKENFYLKEINKVLKKAQRFFQWIN